MSDAGASQNGTYQETVQQYLSQSWIALACSERGTSQQSRKCFPTTLILRCFNLYRHIGRLFAHLRIYNPLY